jgi:hypothetical protein
MVRQSPHTSHVFAYARRFFLTPRHLTTEQDGFLQPKKTYTKTECEALSSHLIHLKSLPQQCMQYTDIATELRRRDSDTTHPTQILS